MSFDHFSGSLPPQNRVRRHFLDHVRRQFLEGFYTAHTRGRDHVRRHFLDPQDSSFGEAFIRPTQEAGTVSGATFGTVPPRTVSGATFWNVSGASWPPGLGAPLSGHLSRPLDGDGRGGRECKRLL